MPAKDKSSTEPDGKLDATGLYCPVPLYQARKKIDTMKIGQILEVIADDPAAEEDFKAWSKTTGNELLDIKKEEDNIFIYIRKTEKK